MFTLLMSAAIETLLLVLFSVFAGSHQLELKIVIFFSDLEGKGNKV